MTSALDAFVAEYLERYPRLEDHFDPQWRSPCEIGEPFEACDGERRIAWQPLRRPAGQSDFAGLERALEVPIHPDVKAYYERYWSGGLEASAADGHVSLLLLWNAEDAERLVENLIGHALAQRRAKAPFSIFFACTEADSELFLTVENESGRVQLEAPGRKPLRVVASSLGEFLEGLTPEPPELHPERRPPGGA
ncbi:MAG: SecY-interacting protein Syd [Pseudomonadota bacterium]